MGIWDERRQEGLQGAPAQLVGAFGAGELHSPYLEVPKLFAE